MNLFLPIQMQKLLLFCECRQSGMGGPHIGSLHRQCPSHSPEDDPNVTNQDLLNDVTLTNLQ